MGTIAALQMGLGFAGILLGSIVVGFCVYFAVLARKSKVHSVAHEKGK